jgi:translation initiation factor IF-2
MSIKVTDLAKELEISIDEILDQLRRLYVDVDDESSKVDDKIAALIRHKFGGATAAKTAKKVKKAEAEAAEVKAKARAVAKKEAKKEAEAAEAAEKAAEKAAPKVEEKPQDETVCAPEAKKPVETDPSAPVKEAAQPIVTPKEFVSPIRMVKRAVPEEKIEEKHKKPLKPEIPKKNELPIKGAMKPKKTDADIVLPLSKILEMAEREEKAIEELEVYEEKEVKAIEPPRKVFKKPAPYRPTFSPSRKEVWEEPKAPVRKGTQKLILELPVSVRALAPKINKKPNEIIQYAIGKGHFLNINQDIDEDLTKQMLTHFGFELEVPVSIASMEKELVEEKHEDDGAALEHRAPVVTFMGHVDHGKTSLLDYIRNTMVAKKEKGGITQHIGAYKVRTAKGSVTFLDTPGHEAFTAMRARGANATDVVVLVVAADDGVMPQTKEAIDHAKAANVPIVVAINKCDLPNAGIDRVKRELQQEGLMSEDWGGKTVMVPVSAKTGEGVDQLVEMLMLESELLDLKANPKIRARGVVIEGRKTSGQGIAATILIKNGTLRANDVVLAGQFYGKVKAMMNHLGERIDEAPPATPVEILGLDGVPDAGEEFFVVKDEKKAKTLAMLKQGVTKQKRMAGNQRATLEDLHNRVLAGEEKELRIVVKADMQGSIEALKHSLNDLSTAEVKVNLLHYGVGNINESDVMLAMVSNAIVLGFHVKIDQKAEEIAKKEEVSVHIYDIIYELIDIIKAAMEGLLEPEEREVFHGRLHVLEVFPSKVRKVAGCMCQKGTVHRKDRVRVKRGDEIVFTGDIDNLRRFKDDVKEVREGFECGISLRNFNDVRKNDIIETFVIEKIARRLER